jgi:hypothetical protein
MDHMKTMKPIVIASLLLLGASVLAAQSLGDVARSARKSKTETSSASHHFDNDNLPSTGSLSVVGPPPAEAAAQPEAGNAAATPDPKAAAAQAAEKQKKIEETQKKLDQQKDKVDALNHELDLDQREYRLRAAAIYGDVGNRLRNSAQWEKEDAQYRNDMDEKRKALDAARQQLSDMQEDARKAGIAEKQKESDKDKDNDKH